MSDITNEGERMSEQSEQINELATALARAQGKITGALKDSSNPFFKSKYADLASCWDACREALSENGLAIVQTTDRGNPVIVKWETTNQETGEVTQYSIDTVEIVIVTMLVHSSGQFIRSRLYLTPRDISPQGIGSTITYGRRYGLSAITGVAQIDDDGNAASGRDNASGKHSPRPDGWKAQDTRKVSEANKRIVEAVNAGHDIVEIWNEYKEDEVFATAVWATLPAPVKNFIKDEVKKRA